MATISYQDFVNNFTIKIKSIRIPHIDETGNSGKYILDLINSIYVLSK